MEFDRCFQFCSKLPETARNVKNIKKVIDFVGFPGIDGIRSMCHFCSKLSEIASNVKNLEKVIDFVGFPGIDGIRSDWSAASWGDTQIGLKSSRWQNRYADSDAGHTHSGRNMEPGPT